MEKQLLTTNHALLQKVILVLFVAILILFLAILGTYQFRRTDPYVQAVLKLEGDSVQGQAIFQMNCAGCHGLEADGKVGPSLRGVSDRKSSTSLIHQVTSGQTPPMPQFQPTPQTMADLLKYLESL